MNAPFHPAEPRPKGAVKKLHVVTHGCQMNVYDSARMADALAPLGYGITQSAADADLIIVNTCHIREKAVEKLYSELGRLRALKEARASAGGRMLLAVAGCVAQAEGAEIQRRAPCVDVVVGPQSYHNLPRLVTDVLQGAGLALDTEFPVESKFDHLPPAGLSGLGAGTASNADANATGPSGGYSAFLTVQEGCDKFCTFCVVPYTRGAESSRPAAAVLDEARALVQRGVREITLLGQNVNAWHGAAGSGPTGKGEWGLGRLIMELAEIDGLERIRYTTSYPAEVDDALIAAHAQVAKLMPFLHLPVQSGSDRILAAMNRRHRAQDYLKLVDRLRAARADLQLASDFIVGFPGEQEADVQATIELIDRVGFVQAYSFKYSPRPGTPAASLPDQIDEETKTERLARVQGAIMRHQRAFNRTTVGRVLPVLFERKGRHAGQLTGRSPYMQAVFAEAPVHAIGRISPVVIYEAKDNSLAGKLCAAEALAGVGS